MNFRNRRSAQSSRWTRAFTNPRKVTQFPFEQSYQCTIIVSLLWRSQQTMHWQKASSPTVEVLHYSTKQMKRCLSCRQAWSWSPPICHVPYQDWLIREGERFLFQGPYLQQSFTLSDKYHFRMVLTRCTRFISTCITFSRFVTLLLHHKRSSNLAAQVVIGFMVIYLPPPCVSDCAEMEILIRPITRQISLTQEKSSF